MVIDEIKTVWIHHFGSKLIMGKHYGTGLEDIVDKRLKIIKGDQHIAGKVAELYKKWRSLEGGSRRPYRAVKSMYVCIDS